MVYPTPPSTPALGAPSGCCPPPTLTFDVDISRSGSINCSPTAVSHRTCVLTFDGIDLYDGMFTFVGDNYHVTIQKTSPTNWHLRITNDAGCGFVNAVLDEDTASFLGPWPDGDASTNTGVCGCADLHVFYNNMVVS